MDLEKSPYFKEDSYSQKVICLYCGMFDKVGENRINCVMGTDRHQTLSWYTWCQACHYKVMLKEIIYELVRERLIKRIDCFQSPHKCTNTNLYVFLDSFQKKCKDHENCWEYYCKKCLGVFHVSKMPLEVKERLEENAMEENAKGRK